MAENSQFPNLGNIRNKMIGKNDQFGQTNIKGQQGTTRVLYDSLEFDNNTFLANGATLRFFEEANTRQFPLTNMGSFGSKLQPGESVAVMYMSFSLLVLTTIEDRTTCEVNPLWKFSECMSLAEFTMKIANQQVIKPIPIMETRPDFSKDDNPGSNKYTFLSTLIIPPMIDFSVELKFPQIVGKLTPDQRAYIRCSIEGLGSILASKTTF